jgi:predicted Na+-dependent transporter
MDRLRLPRYTGGPTFTPTHRRHIDAGPRMSLLRAIAAALAWLGRQGTRAIAISVFAGLALPQLAALLKPAFTPALAVLLCLSFLRVEPQALRACLRRPALVIAASLWIMLAIPLVFAGALKLSGLDALAPGLFIALILQAIAPPVIASPTVAALLRIDAALSLATLLVCTAAIPFTGPLFAAAFIGAEIALSPVQLGLRLAGLLAISALAALVVRRIAGQRRIERQKEPIDGLSVIALFVFAVGLMDGVTAALWTRPALVAGLVAGAFLLALLFGVLTFAVFLRAGHAQALALAFCAGSRNMGLLLAAMGGFVPDLTWLYFALAQFPIFLLPQLLKPLSQRINRPG